MKRNFKFFSLLLLISLTLLPTTYADTKHLHNYGSPQRGNLYAMRGLMGHVNSEGLDVMCARAINALNISTTTVPYTQWQQLSRVIINRYYSHKLTSPIILVGHSFGADDQIKVAWALYSAKIPVDLLITLDPVSPQRIPPNVKRATNIFVSVPGKENTPMFRGIAVYAANPQKTNLQNFDLRFNALGFDTSRIDHFNIDDNIKIQNVILKQIQKVMIARNIKA